MYSSTLSLTSAPDWVGGQRHAPTPRKETRYPLYRTGGPQGRSGQVRKISPTPGFDRRTFPARSKSLHRLSYPGPLLRGTTWNSKHIRQPAKRMVLYSVPNLYSSTTSTERQSQWPRGLRCASAAARLLGLRVRIPPGAWMSVSCECCVLSEVSSTGRSLVQRSHTKCGASVFAKAEKRGCPGQLGLSSHEKKIHGVKNSNQETQSYNRRAIYELK